MGFLLLGLKERAEAGGSFLSGVIVNGTCFESLREASLTEALPGLFCSQLPHL